MLKVISIKFPYQFLEIPHEKLAWVFNLTVPTLALTFYLCEHFSNGYICKKQQTLYLAQIFSRFEIKKELFFSLFKENSFSFTYLILVAVTLFGIATSLYVLYLLYREKKNQQQRILPVLQQNESSASENNSNKSTLVVGLSGSLTLVTILCLVMENVMPSLFIFSFAIAIIETISMTIVMCSDNVFLFVCRKVNNKFLS